MKSDSILSIIQAFQEDSLKLEALKACSNNMNPFDITTIISTLKEDNIKKEALEVCSTNMFGDHIATIIRSFKEESLRIEALERYSTKMVGYDISGIISTFEGDRLKLNALKANLSNMNKEGIASIVQMIQDDDIKLEALKVCSVNMNQRNVAEIINKLEKDDIKLEALKACLGNIDEHSAFQIIHQFQDDSLKEEALKTYADYLDSFEIAPIIASLQDDNKRLELLQKYETKIKDNVGRIITIFQEDSVKIQLLKEYAEKIDTIDILHIIDSFKEKSAKFEALNVYADKVFEFNGDFNIMRIIDTLEESDRLELLEKYKERMNRYTVTSIIRSFNDEMKITQLEKCHNNNISLDIGGVIVSFANDETKMELIEKYSKSTSLEYVSLILNLRADKNKISLFKKYEGKILQKKSIDIATILGSVERNAENYSLLNPELDEFIKQYPRVLGKHNLKDLKEYFFNQLVDTISSRYFGHDFDGYYDFGYDSEKGEQEYAEAKSNWKAIKSWLEIGFIPHPKLFEKVPKDKVCDFKPKTWFKLAKEPVFNISDESKMALVELAYCFGVFDEQNVEISGKGKLIDTVTAEERRSGKVNDTQKRINEILEMVHNGKLTNDNLHMMFDGTNMKFDPAFYRFFVEYQDEIFANADIMRQIPKIQREMPQIMKKCRGNIPTIAQCERYFSEIRYDGIEEGNAHLAEVCHMAGVTQEKFEAYQELYDRQKQRNKESTIPELKGKNYQILPLTSPETLVIGEGGFSRCCQQIGGAGEQCMVHSATSQNGRLVVIKDDDGRFIAQSWIWRNGNVVCFDSIEANAIENNTDAEQNQYIALIEKTYRQIAKDMIEKSQETVGQFKKDKLAKIEREEIDEKEKQEKREKIEAICDASQIKRVTVGQGYWPISQRITERFSDRVVSTEKGRVSPRERVSYIADSDTQFIVEELENLKQEEIKTNTDVQVRYRDKRRKVREVGENIQADTIYKIKQIESEAHKGQMQIMQQTNNVYDLASEYNCEPENLRIIHGSDWYYIYANNEESIHIYDLARGKPRFADERSAGSIEMGKALDSIMIEAWKDNKDVEAELREDTSYLLLLELKKNGLIEQVGPDETFQFGDEDSWNRRAVSEEEQIEILNRKEEIKEKEAIEENTTMHHMMFRPTEKYKNVLKRRYQRKEEEH